MSTSSSDQQLRYDLNNPPVDSLTGKTLVDTIRYDDRIVSKFMLAAMIWGMVGFLVGIILALQLTGMGSRYWEWTNVEWLSFGRLRPLHTNAVIFAFVGNIVFGGVYYSLQRLLKARMWNDTLSLINFWGWQLIIVAAAVSLPFGYTTSKEYAELEWPIDIAIALVWVIFGTNMFGTIAKRRERHLYVAIWFYIATWCGITMLHVVNSMAVPVDGLKSYSAYAGVQDALVQWWYGHNAVAFFLTTPILGLMYYYLPKAAGRPVYSYRLSIIHFWSLVFIYIWAGPHHLLNTSLPEWAQTLGVTFSIVLIMPSWGGMINGLLTLRGAFDKVKQDPVLKFFVVAITFYGMATFEGPMMSLRAVNALSHNTDWTIGHVHGGALGWNGMLGFGLLYWLVPRLWRTELHSVRLANYHFWIGTAGIVLYMISMWASGLIQGVMWFAFDEEGFLKYQDWIQIVDATLIPQYIRLIGGVFFISGASLMCYNLVKTISSGQKVVDEEVQVLPLWNDPDISLDNELQDANKRGANFAEKGNIVHAAIERWPLTMIVLTIISLSVGTVFELIPTMIQGKLTPKIASVTPYTPLELEGRDIYIREGCVGCHTQMVRTLRPDVARYGDYTRAGETIYDRPFLWGSKRTGPDLAREGIIRPDAAWHWRHMYDPQSTSAGSVMPAYQNLYENKTNYAGILPKVATLSNAILQTPYTEDEIARADEIAKEQARQIGDALIASDNGLIPAVPDDVHDKEIIALIAYLQRLGTDLTKETK